MMRVLGLRLMVVAVLAMIGLAGVAGAQELAADSLGAANAPTTIQEAPEGVDGNFGWLSILPALIAIGAALAFRQVVAALFLGVLVGAVTVAGDPVTGLFDTIDTYILTALAGEVDGTDHDTGHAAIILFTLMIGGMVGIIQRNGGTRAIVNSVTRWARSAGRGQLATAFLGTAVFFDDYANTLIVGGTMRPITDTLRISREKLAYIVDSTAAPIASLALVTTWIGYEVGLIGTAVADLDGYSEGAYSIFLNSIPYSFYPLLALLLVYVVASSRRDFGPMLKAERRARQTGQLTRPGSDASAAEAEGELLQPPEDKPARLINAVLPIVTLVVAVLVGLWITGAESIRSEGGELTIRDVIGAADSYKAMMWASILGVIVAVGLSVGQRILTLTEVMDAWFVGMRSMLLALVILVLAWALANVNDALGTAPFLVDLLSGSLAPWMVPALVFILAAFVAFATGSSWSTMGILMPLVIPLVWGVLVAEGQAQDLHILYSTVACVLAGSVWGDHCSPISDTTILSSLASQCDHVDHVRTQLPYALTVGLVAILLGTIPTALGAPWWVMLPLAAATLLGIFFFLSQPVEEEEQVVA
ncbi:MAG: Na+/H+ antiporter NhaC family protein [Bacteroidota bacterium]